jgi:demethylmenaquinone methyltransferase/2-methoxy-6-polyprenyl-1,4-benzoquinol methylase
MNRGTTPPGVQGDEQVARWVRTMFEGVAPRYDLLNHLLSFNIDKHWRKRTVKTVREVLHRPNARVLDICCGTGDLMLAMQAECASKVYGSDFCHPMLTVAQEKSRGGPLFESDALALPIADSSLDLITVAFGLRNFADYRKGLREMMRVLKPGGTAAILEFTQPPNKAFRAFYNFYSLHILPVLGSAISGSKDAYTYLPESVKKFPDAPTLAKVMQEEGYTTVKFDYMTLGIVALHVGQSGILRPSGTRPKN